MDSKAPNKTPARKDAHAPEIDNVMETIRLYGPAAALGLVLAVAIFLGITFHRHRQASMRVEASQRFMRAQTADELQMIVDDYPGTVTAPMALLALASERYHEGQIEQAEQQYRRFLEEYSDHFMRPAAELGFAYCDEAHGRLENALQGFRAFQAARGDHYLFDLARLGEARVLGQLARFDEARAIYDDILDDPEHPWRAQARSDLMYMEKEIRARAE